MISKCPLDGKPCDYPDGKFPMRELVDDFGNFGDFVGCKTVDYGRSKVLWVCGRFPKGLSITAARNAFARMWGYRDANQLPVVFRREE